jgi:hypothetical protein
VVKIKNFEERGFYAIIDSASNKVIKVLKYDQVMDFSNKLAGVQLNDKWGLINTEGVEITEIIYDNIEEFSNGMAVVALNKKFGAVNTLGKEVTGIKYDYVYGFSDNISLVSLNNSYGYINKTGIEVCPLIYSKGGYTGFGNYNSKLFKVQRDELFFLLPILSTTKFTFLVEIQKVLLSLSYQEKRKRALLESNLLRNILIR